jgi:hypothetical protein
MLQMAVTQFKIINGWTFCESIKQLAPVRRELGWGPRLWRGADSLRLIWESRRWRDRLAKWLPKDSKGDFLRGYQYDKAKLAEGRERDASGFLYA